MAGSFPIPAMATRAKLFIVKGPPTPGENGLLGQKKSPHDAHQCGRDTEDQHIGAVHIDTHKLGPLGILSHSDRRSAESGFLKKPQAVPGVSPRPGQQRRNHRFRNVCPLCWPMLLHSPDSVSAVGWWRLGSRPVSAQWRYRRSE